MKKILLYAFAFFASGLSLVNMAFIGVMVAGSFYGILHETDSFYLTGAYIAFGFFLVLLAVELFESSNRRRPWDFHLATVIVFVLARLIWVLIAIAVIMSYFADIYTNDVFAALFLFGGSLLLLVNLLMFINYLLLLFPRYKWSLKDYAERNNIAHLL